MSDGDWQRRAPYGDQSSASGGGRRRAGGQAGAPPHAQDSYGQNPYGQDPYAQDPYAQPPQGYAPPGYGEQPGYAPAPPPPAAPPAAASGRGRRAAPRTGPKVVQSEVISPRAQDYGYDSRDGYGTDPYAQPGDPYGSADDGWNDAASRGYVDDRYDTGRGGYSGGDDGWDDRGDGDWGDDDFMDSGPPRRSKLRAWAPLFALIIVLGAFSGCMYGGYAYYKSKHGPAPDYANTNCPGPVDGKDPVKDQGKAVIEIPAGAIGAKIGQILYDGGVVKSVRAYVQAANADQSSSGIQSGTFDICKGISGSQAVKELLKNSNIEKNSQIDVQSHQWSTDVIAWLVQHRHWDKSLFDAAIKNNTIGLPAWAKDAQGNFTVEGMLEPGQYQLTSKDNPQTVLTAMVKHRMDKLTAINFEANAKKMTCGTVPCTPEQVLTIASLAEAEVPNPTDASGVAEGIYNRLKANDFLGIDSSAQYGIQSHKPPTPDQVNDPNDLYATGSHKGLPPGPVSIPSIDTISAVLSPTSNHVYYWCSKTGATTTFYRVNQKALFASQCLSAPKS